MAKELENLICQVSDLRLGFSPRSCLNDRGWSFSLTCGDLIGLIGPNGSGKTTLLRALMGERTLLSGEVKVSGLTCSVQRWTAKEIAHTFSYLPQEQPHEPSQRVDQFLSMAFISTNGLFGSVSRDQIERLEKQIQLFELGKHRTRTLDSLSTGERQRVFLARVLLQPSQIVLLDEPTNHLDPEGLARFWSTLRELKGEKTVVVSTHDIDFVKKMTDTILALKDGNLVFSGETAEFFRGSFIQQLFPSLANS